jgi:hypothetical protein
MKRNIFAVFAFAAYIILAGLWFDSVFATDRVAGDNPAVQPTSHS